MPSSLQIIDNFFHIIHIDYIEIVEEKTNLLKKQPSQKQVSYQWKPVFQFNIILKQLSSVSALLVRTCL